MARIVDTDNYGGDYPNEKIVLWHMSKESVQAIADILNKDAGRDSSRYYIVVENDYVLQSGFEP